jgi:NAD(P)-dependent dehydrogenase (short-subunit alcohol dehydrogenase family)
VLEGCRVALLARSTEYLETLAAELNANHKADSAFALPCDLTNAQEIREAFTQVRRRLGPVDLLVNHASGGGGPAGAGLLDLDPANFEQAWRVGAYAALLCSREAARDMLSSKRGNPRGAILFSGATSSVRGASLAFSSAKFASRGLAQGLARELWPQGIHVAHVVIDGIIGAPEGESTETDFGEPLMHPDAIAEAYWGLIRQDRSAWTLELDLRPHREKFFE